MKKKGLCTQYLTNMVDFRTRKKGTNARVGRHSAKKTIKKWLPFSGKKIPGIILISLNDTNLSEFLAHELSAERALISHRAHDESHRGPYLGSVNETFVFVSG